MLAGRLIVGIGSSFQVCLPPLGLSLTCQGIGGGPLVAEVSHPRNRPQCTALINTCWYIGSIIAAWVTFGALNISGAWSWRLCCLIQIVPAAIQLILVWFVEESPRWLISKGKEEKALQVLAKYHANGDEQDELVQFEFEEIRDAIAKERSAVDGVSLKSFVKTKGNRHRLLILIVSPLVTLADPSASPSTPNGSETVSSLTTSPRFSPRSVSQTRPRRLGLTVDFRSSIGLPPSPVPSLQSGSGDASSG